MNFYYADAALEQAKEKLIQDLFDKFVHLNLSRKNIALTVILNKPRQLSWGTNFRGNDLIYPASVIKLFYMAATFIWAEHNKLIFNTEIRRALKAMIRESSNDATNYIIDILTQTTSGPELTSSSLKNWVKKRRIIQNYFRTLKWPEFNNIVLTQKTWDEGPYGREYQSRYQIPNNRNVLTTNAVARLLWAIEKEELVKQKFSLEIKQLLKRSLDPTLWKNNLTYQVQGFMGQALPHNASLWSKAGWTSTTRHDAAIIKLPHKRTKIIFVIFTYGSKIAQSSELIPYATKRLIKILDNNLML
ncbi:MAG: class A beta-lactamase-related serine hydrolase [Alphaproteobacteria bacterium]|nr:class A beta-lactamase-related serine hydrolase [Alphaproteobacteria bacterium]